MFAVLGEFQNRADDLLEVARCFLVTGAEHDRRQVENLDFILFGDPHHVADDLQRQRAGQ
jgi:hypothetical protein